MKKSAKLHHSKIIDQLLNSTSVIEKLKVSAKMNIAANIYEILISKNISIEDFADMLKTSPEKINHYLSGTYNFTIDELIELSSILEIDLKDIV